jgi:hypothetical protein
MRKTRATKDQKSKFWHSPKTKPPRKKKRSKETQKEQRDARGFLFSPFASLLLSLLCFSFCCGESLTDLLFQKNKIKNEPQMA